MTGYQPIPHAAVALNTIEFSGGTSLDITKNSLRMFAHRPVLVWGLGTFPTVYTRYRSFYTNLFINEAHNNYDQLLVEMGCSGSG